MAPSFPAIYLLRSHFEHDLKELQRLEKQIDVVYNINEAELILGKVKSKARAAHELRKLGLYTEDVNGNNPEDEGALSPHSKKRRRLDKIVVDGKEVIALDSETESGSDTDIRARKHPSSSKRKSSSAAKNSPTARKQAAVGSQEEVSGKTINVLKLEWYIDSVKNGHLLPFENYLVYEGRVIPKPKPQKPEVKVPVLRSGNSILARAKADSPPPASRRPHKAGSRAPASPSSQRPHLLSQTTTDEDLPPIPEYLHTIYSCQRPTPLHGPNDAFLSQLRIIKKARTLTTGDDKNVHARAYNAAVATIASYPYTLTSAHEITRLPNCGKKLATLWEEWTSTGHIKEVDDIENDDRMKSLNIFYEIHDVAEKSARKFYNNGWRDLDDVVEYGCMGKLFL
jgi:DNA polymerase IV